MNYFGESRVVTQNFLQHKSKAEDYAGAFRSNIRINGKAKVIKVVDRYQSYENTINYDDFKLHAAEWKKGDYYNCVSITGKTISYHRDELGGNSILLEFFEGSKRLTLGLYHLDLIYVKLGDIVDSNTLMAKQGNTGLVNSSKKRTDITYGSHVHCEVKDELGNFISPRKYASGEILLSYVSTDSEVKTMKEQIKIHANELPVYLEADVASKENGVVLKDQLYSVLKIVSNQGENWIQINVNGTLGYVVEYQKGDIEKLSETIDKELPLGDSKGDSIKQPDPISVLPVVKTEEVITKDTARLLFLYRCQKEGNYAIKLNEGEELRIYLTK